MTTRWKECWNVAPDIHILLRESETLEDSRNRFVNYLNTRSYALGS